jgi:hypothetical protein
LAGVVPAARALQDARDEPGHASREGRQDASNVVGVPITCHVALAEPDQAVVAKAAEELRGTVQAHDRRC